VTKVPEGITFDPRVAVARAGASDYAEGPGAADEEMRKALRRAAGLLGWAGEGDEGAFARVIPAGARVLVKPNLVMHENQGPWGMEPLVTHQSLIRVAVEEALRSGAGEVAVGDAPLQACDFGEMTRRMGLDSWAEELSRREPRFRGVRDFRRTVSTVVGGVREAAEELQPLDRFVLFDLAGESLLEPITDDGGRFRVTCYDPRLLARTHAPGRHQYLVAREVVEADVVINLPKLKTHKKAGLTCALKNLIGINGNKEFLPHHRVGGPRSGGDCYEGGGLLKGALERLADLQNTSGTRAGARLWHGLSVPIDRALRMAGKDAEIEGAWSGNDTIWRTCLDLNRLLLYGRADGTLADEVQRRVLHVVDAVVAGQGDGPLAPRPLPLGLLLAGANAAAVDWAGAHLLGYDPAKIPIAREAFGRFSLPLTAFASCEVCAAGDLGAGRADEVLPPHRAARVVYPAGWLDAVVRPSVGDAAGAAEREDAGAKSFTP
jgi:uncharacterized protein (DUF362 family)